MKANYDRGIKSKRRVPGDHIFVGNARRLVVLEDWTCINWIWGLSGSYELWAAHCIAGALSADSTGFVVCRHLTLKTLTLCIIPGTQDFDSRKWQRIRLETSDCINDFELALSYDILLCGSAVGNAGAE